MKIILYANGINNIGEQLENIIHTQVSRTKIQTCNSIELLSQILRQPLNNVSVVILIIDSKEELIQFNLMNMLFDNSRVILILPDRSKETLALGFKLKTSFVSYVDSDLQDVASVLRQIQKKIKENIKNV
ncbi:MAG: hypothetical protein KAJ62_03750 [Desulfobacteraceae bacterium]|nr:hypothetical protein [Desulfobacteraceae bacterium]